MPTEQPPRYSILLYIRVPYSSRKVLRTDIDMPKVDLEEGIDESE